jgi:hypothetical protein
MKKLAVSLALLSAMAIGATSAHAADIKASGSWQIDATEFSQADFDKGTKDNTFSVSQRIRTAFQFIANENLKGVLETQIGTNNWGNGQYQIGSGRTAGTASGSNSYSGGSLVLRKAYLDFKWPDTKINILAGYQSLTLPSAFGGGSAILDDHMAGAAVVVPVNSNLSVVVGYARPYDSNTSGSTANSISQSSGSAMDAGFAYANLDYAGIKVQPFLAYAHAGATAVTNYANAFTAGNAKSLGLSAPNADPDGVDAYWAGAAFTMTAFDPFKIMANLNFGKANFNSLENYSKSGRTGWLGDVAVDYTGLSMMTPELFFAYSSGENSDLSKSERMPTLSGENWAYGTFWMQGGDSLIASNTTPADNLGFWAVGLSLKDIKLIDKLSHTVNLIYFKGTNDKSIVTATSVFMSGRSYGNVLTEKDSLWELDVNSKYQIYDELSLGLELSYIHTDFDKDLWAGHGGASRDSSYLSKDAYKAALMLNYSF